MKFITSVILTALLSYALCLFLPWWSIAIAAFVVSAFVAQTAWHSFLSGFLSLLLFWGAFAWLISIANQHILANRISVLVFKNDNPLLLILMTALIGALVAGLAALAGSFAHRRIRPAR